MCQGLTIVLALLIAGDNNRPAQGGEKPLPTSLVGHRVAPLLLLSRTDVQAELGLDARQTSDAEKAIQALYVRAYDLRGKRGEGAVAARRAIDDDQQRWLESRLSDAQFQRLVQIDLQWEGPSALISRPALADSLGLTLQQRQTLGRALDEVKRKRASHVLRRNDEVKFASDTWEMLTKPQREQWTAMLGPRFVPKP